MHNFLEISAYAGIVISLLAFELGSILKKKFKFAVFNPLLVGIVLTIVFLLVFHIDFEVYNASAKFLSWLLTPATVCLAIPLYEEFQLLVKNKVAVLVGIISGVLSSLLSVLAFSLILGFDHKQYVTLLPKSITTAIGMGVSEELEGYVAITVAVIVLTGVIGNMIAEYIFKIFKIEEPIAQGLALGTSAHAVGTAKAIELGDIQGAMSSLSIAVAGILTVLLAPIFANFM